MIAKMKSHANDALHLTHTTFVWEFDQKDDFTGIISVLQNGFLRTHRADDNEVDTCEPIDFSQLVQLTFIHIIKIAINSHI